MRSGRMRYKSFLNVRNFRKVRCENNERRNHRVGPSEQGGHVIPPFLLMIEKNSNQTSTYR